VDLTDPHPGPGQVRIAVRAAGVNPSDWKKRNGLMDEEVPQTIVHEAAGVVDELGEGVADVAVGDRVFGFSGEEAAQAERRNAGDRSGRQSPREALRISIFLSRTPRMKRLGLTLQAYYQAAYR
jgi:NADPH:quinone reductase-like Zn-dependent oxidoreductase